MCCCSTLPTALQSARDRYRFRPLITLDQILEKLHINEEIHKSILVADDEGEDMVVPLEEALLVDSPAQKRKLILSVLTDDPAGYYDLLQQARMDNDSEVVHYASTALSQITKEADLKLQKLEQRYAAAPDDAAVLEEYCNYLESYLKDGFVQGRAAEIQRHQRSANVLLSPLPLRQMTSSSGANSIIT